MINASVMQPETPGSPLSRYHIECLRSQDELLNLQAPWNDLTNEINNCSFFLTWDWIFNWWKYLHANHDLWLLTAKNQDGRIVGIAPLMRSHRKFGPLVFRRISFIGEGIAQPVHLDIVACHGKGRALTVAFLQFLHEHEKEWDVLELKGLRQDSPLEDCLSSAKGQSILRKQIESPLVSLPGTWEVFQNEQMSGKLRKTIRYYQRRLEKAFPGKVDFCSVSNKSDLNGILDFLIKTVRSRYINSNYDSCFDDQAFCEFYRNFVIETFDLGHQFFLQLKVNNEIVAVQHCLQYRNILYGYQMAFDPSWEMYSPGQQLLAYLFKEAIHSGKAEVDMMELGSNNRYKSTWASGVRIDSHVLYGRNIRGRLWLLTVSLFDVSILFFGKILPEPARKYLNQLLAKKLAS
jgi:CelD/BcsL family acetyltransferase involved in cellulose biosynthesis